MWIFSDFRKWCFFLFFFEKNDILKTKSKINLKKIGYPFFYRYFYIKNYGEHLKHHRQILIELSRNIVYVYLKTEWNNTHQKVQLEFLVIDIGMSIQYCNITIVDQYHGCGQCQGSVSVEFNFSAACGTSVVSDTRHARKRHVKAKAATTNRGWSFPVI